MPTQENLKKTRKLIDKLDAKIASLQKKADLYANIDPNLRRCLQRQRTQDLPLYQQYENLKQFAKTNNNRVADPIVVSQSRKLVVLLKCKSFLQESIHDIGAAKRGSDFLNSLFGISRFDGTTYHYAAAFENAAWGAFSATKRLCSETRKLLKERVSVEAEAAQSAGQWRTASPVLNTLQSFQVTSSAPSPEANAPGQS
ncbi:hypothetical protein DA717_06690 [Piscirickettsiaceae bacterium NZ-RLO2]|nr:hypothetical protein DA717_06690 [Piscirickettsiaceae bacterium NZ-RLO2]